ncbi:MAG: DUF3842 family protein [Bacilli bacterium]|nr:DUF3842 family protein [Bacilli bacterium]
MNITIIDGQGGQLGAQLIKEISNKFSNIIITAIGTNSIATATMLKAGAKNAATGENAVVVASRKADVIVGPVGIVIADSLLGEITDKMALAIGKSDAIKLLIPINKCNNIIAGVSNLNTKALIEDTLLKLEDIIK